MTSENKEPLVARRRRLVPRDTLAADYLARYGSPAVAEYALSVRDVAENCPRIGPVDTWSRLARQVARQRRRVDWQQLRRRLSRHFTAETKGPPWPTTVLVVEFALSVERRQPELDRLAWLYRAARGEWPPTGQPGGTEAAGNDAGRIAQLERENAHLRERLETSELEAAYWRSHRRRSAERAPNSGPVPPGGGAAELLREARNPGRFGGRTSTADAEAALAGVRNRPGRPLLDFRDTTRGAAGGRADRPTGRGATTSPDPSAGQQEWPENPGQAETQRIRPTMPVS